MDFQRTMRTTVQPVTKPKDVPLELAQQLLGNIRPEKLARYLCDLLTLINAEFQPENGDLKVRVVPKNDSRNSYEFHIRKILSPEGSLPMLALSPPEGIRLVDNQITEQGKRKMIILTYEAVAKVRRSPSPVEHRGRSRRKQRAPSSSVSSESPPPPPRTHSRSPRRRRTPSPPPRHRTPSPSPRRRTPSPPPAPIKRRGPQRKSFLGIF